MLSMEYIKENKNYYEEKISELNDKVKYYQNKTQRQNKEIERLNNIINELKQKNNLAENILYDYLYNDGKITKEKYEQFKGMKGGK